MRDLEAHRRHLFGVAYRMLGSVADAEDVVQDAYVRWQQGDRSDVEDPRAFLTRVVTRLCLDRLGSAQRRREEYVGTWLPEPVVEDPAAAVAEDLSVALLLTLERLSPLERAAFLLHDVFDVDYPDIAATLERNEAACRQLVARAREHVRDARPRFASSPETEARLVAAVGEALGGGDLARLAEVLAEDAVLYTDGGGKRLAALNPILGRDRIIRFAEGLRKKNIRGGRVEAVRLARINGLPGYVSRDAEGWQTIAVEADGDRIVAVYIVRNPEKLGHVGES